MSRKSEQLAKAYMTVSVLSMFILIGILIGLKWALVGLTAWITFNAFWTAVKIINEDQS